MTAFKSASLVAAGALLRVRQRRQEARPDAADQPDHRLSGGRRRQLGGILHQHLPQPQSVPNCLVNLEDVASVEN